LDILVQGGLVNGDNMAEKILIKKKEFTFRGKSVDELKSMTIREFSDLLKSNEKRTLLRQTDKIHLFLKKIIDKESKKKPIRTHNRYLVIVPGMIGKRISIHDGKNFFSIEVINEMLGHRFGEFAPTRTKVKHGAAGVGATRGSASMSVK